MTEYVDVILAQKVSHPNPWFVLISSASIFIMWMEGCSGLTSMWFKVFICTAKHLFTSSSFSFVTLCVSAKFSLIHCVFFLNWSCGWPWSQPVVLKSLQSIYSITQMSECLSLCIIVHKKGLFPLTQVSRTQLCFYKHAYLRMCHFAILSQVFS